MLEGGTDLALEAAGDAAAAVEAREDPAFLASAAKCPFKGRRCVDFATGLWKDFVSKVAGMVWA